MKAAIIVLALAVSAPAFAQEPVGCDKFKWPLDKERATLTGTDLPKVTSGDRVKWPIPFGMSVALVPFADAKLPTPPERAPKSPTSFAGFVEVAAPAKAGTYKITLSSEGWIDVVQDGQAVKSTAFSGATGLRRHPQKREIRSRRAPAYHRTQQRPVKRDRDRGQRGLNRRKAPRQRHPGRGTPAIGSKQTSGEENIMTRRDLLKLGATGSASVALLGQPSLSSRCALAQSDYPNKPVRIVVDSAVGSANDVSARILADKLGQIWNQQVIILNQPGAGGGISARVAATSPNDGYTLYLPATSAFLALPGGPGVAPNMPVELPRDFAAIGFVLQQPIFIAASPKSGIDSIAELIARAKEKPNELSYASTGRGRLTHLTMELLQARADVQLRLVPYAGGPAQAMGDVVADRVDLVLDAYAGLAGAAQSGLIKMLASTSSQRLPGMEKPADRRRDDAGLLRRRVESDAGAGRHARHHNPQGQRRSAHRGRRQGGLGQIRGQRRLHALPDA